MTQSCLFSGAFWGGIALLIIGGIAFIVGFIGVLIGISRLGTRYSRWTFKVAAILSIIPYLNVAAAVLILLEARAAARKLS